MNEKTDRKNKIAFKYPYSDCRKCNNVLEIVKFPNTMNEVVEVCPHCNKVTTIRRLMYNSNVPIDFMTSDNLDFKKYNMYIDTDIKYQNVLLDYVQNKNRVIDNVVNLYLQSGDIEYSQMICCSILTNFIESGYNCRLYDGRLLVDTIKNSMFDENKYKFYNKYDKSYSYKISHYTDIWLDMFVEYNDLIAIVDLDFVNLSVAVKNKLISMLNERRNNNLSTIILSSNNFREVVFVYSLTKYIFVELGVRDNDFLQRELILKLRK